MSKKQVKTIINILVACAIAILLTMAFSSCYTEKKATKQVNKALLKKPLVVAKIARDAFPCITTSQDTVIVTTDSTIYIECPETTTTPSSDYTANIQPAPTVKTKMVRVPVTIPIQTRYITKRIKDSAIVTITITELQKVNSKNEALTATIARKNKIILILFILLGVLGVGIFLKNKFF